MDPKHLLLRLGTFARPPINEWRGQPLLLADLAGSVEDLCSTADARTAAIFVAYHPDCGFAERVGATLKQVDHAYVVDNTPGGAEGATDLGRQHPRTTVVGMGGNAGLGAALNRGASRAMADGYDYALLMNQDDAPLAGMVKALHVALHWWPGRAAIAAPVRVDRNVGPSEDVQEKGRAWRVAAVGTAGSLLDLRVFREAGPFREDLFVDQVDYEYCLRVRRKGYDVVQTGDAVIESALGASSRHRLAGLSVVTTNHSPVRRYYIARNRLIVARDYPDFPEYRRLQRYATIREVRNIILFEDRRMAKLIMTVRGLWDYWRGRSGPLASIRHDRADA